MTRTRIALIGCGRILQKHLDGIAENGEDAEIVAVCDLIESKAVAAAEKLGIPHYSDFDVMLREVPCDLVSVLTDSGSHASITIAVLKDHGLDVLVEKPMAITLEDADAMIAAAKEAGRRLFVVKQNRFNPPIVKTREAKEAGRFGTMVMGTVRLRWRRDQGYYDQADWRGTWAEDGGALTNQTIHYIDLMTWLMDSPIETVFARTATRLVTIEAEDTAAVVLTFANGALGIIEATTATRPLNLEASVSLLGEGGTVVLGGFATNELVTWNFSDEPEGAPKPDLSYPIDNVYGYGHVALYADVIEAQRTGKRALIEGDDGRRVLALLHAIYHSAEAGCPVDFHPEKYFDASPLGRGVNDP
jgi:predicted dehydrogenase